MSAPQSPAAFALDLAAIPYRLFQHASPPSSLQAAAAERGQEPGQIVRSLLFRIHKGSYFLVLIAGPSQLSWQRLRKHLGLRRISLADEAEVLQVTGYPIGTVNPFGLQTVIPILADVSVFHPAEISLGSGIPGLAIIMRSQDLRQALGPIQVGLFSA